MKKFFAVIFLSTCFFSVRLLAQLNSENQPYSHADSLRGSITPQRIWWDALQYNVDVKFDIAGKNISGSNTILYKVLSPYQIMQIDLMKPLVIDSVLQDGKLLSYTQDGNAYFIQLIKQQEIFDRNKIKIYYHGSPVVAKNPPWDGGIVWTKDTAENPWISFACQGVGPSIWYPNKDNQYDEPDSASINITVPANVSAIANGRLVAKSNDKDGNTTWSWKITSPINNYNLIPYIGNYANYNQIYKGENGNLDVSLYFLKENMQKAIEHVYPDVIRTLKAFEYWFGPYPFYADGYKIVEAPYLGMEHQSAIAYGNKFLNGYLGMDLSGSGAGLKWDFIVVHESGHEWFGNNISAKDIADMWVHEGITCYSEVLFTEYWYGKQEAQKYIVGIRKNIENDKPVIGPYNVNKEGSGDMYYKGANLIHTIRQIINDDTLFRNILRGMNAQFFHSVVSSKVIENYISQTSGIDLSKIFDQYLRTTQIPVFEYKIENKKGKYYLSYCWNNCVDGFNMPLKIYLNGNSKFIYPQKEWQSVELKNAGDIDEKNLVDKNFYVDVKKIQN